jgi:hypothetical protein
LDRNKFNYIVRKYAGDKYVKHFTCWNQLLALMFGQLSNRESLRDLIVAFEAHHSKCYHLGMGRNVSRSSLSRTNHDRDYHIFEEYAYCLVSEARQKRATDIFELGGNVYAFDSTTIDLYLAVFWWAKFRKKKGGIKVHTLYDVEYHQCNQEAAFCLLFRQPPVFRLFAGYSRYNSITGISTSGRRTGRFNVTLLPSTR